MSLANLVSYADRLSALAEQFPVGARVSHSGHTGTVVPAYAASSRLLPVTSEFHCGGAFFHPGGGLGPDAERIAVRMDGLGNVAAKRPGCLRLLPSERAFIVPNDRPGCLYEVEAPKVVADAVHSSRWRIVRWSGDSTRHGSEWITTPGAWLNSDNTIYRAADAGYDAGYHAGAAKGRAEASVAVKRALEQLS